MFCSKCGGQNPDNSAFCIKCGEKLQPSSATQPPASSYASQGRYPAYTVQKPKKSRKGLVIGLITGGAIIVVAVLLILLLPSKDSVLAGVWYNEEYAEVLEFDENGHLHVYNASGEITYEYNFDSGESSGVIDIDGVDIGFSVDKSKLKIEGLSVYRHADSNFDIVEFLEDAGKATSTPAPTSAVTPAPTATPTLTPVPTVTAQNMTLEFAFGSCTGPYSGEVNESGLPHGYGTFSWLNSNGDTFIYEGDWANGHINGYGTLTYPNEVFVYTGYFENDYVAQGEEYHRGLLSYDGGFSNDQYNYYNGYGTYYNYSGEAVYTGDWANCFIKEDAASKAQRIQAFKAQCEALPYNKLYTQAEIESGAHIKVQGTVSFVYGNTRQGTCNFLIFNPQATEGNETVYVSYRLSEGEARIQAGQEVTVWGSADYLYSYEASSGKTITVPLVEAWAVE